jgi:hypothetical protein
VAWLAVVLDGRDFPLDRLRRDLQLCADVVQDTRAPWAPDIARRLRAATSEVRA